MDADEAEAEALDRNWNELLQELRVTQTGLQILTGFLLTLPFQQRFSQLDTYERGVYLGALAVTVTATVLVLAPAHFHRMLFRQQEKPWLVLAGNRCALASLYLSAVAVTTVTFLLFDVVLGRGGRRGGGRRRGSRLPRRVVGGAAAHPAPVRPAPHAAALTAFVTRSGGPAGRPRAATRRGRCPCRGGSRTPRRAPRPATTGRCRPARRRSRRAGRTPP